METLFVLVLVLVGIHAAIFLCLLYLAWAREREEEARKREEAREREEATNRRIAGNALRLLCDMVQADLLVIDSNIWIDEQYDSFFWCLRRVAMKSRRQLVVLGPQLDEICALTRSAICENNCRARRAIERIEDFQKDNLVTVRSITPNAATDTYVIDLLVAEARAAKSIRFVSDVVEHRIRVRECLRGFPATQWQVIDIETLITNFATLEVNSTLFDALEVTAELHPGSPDRHTYSEVESVGEPQLISTSFKSVNELVAKCKAALAPRYPNHST